MKYPYKVTKERSGAHEYWVARSQGPKGLVGQGDTLKEAAKRIRALTPTASNFVDMVEVIKAMGGKVTRVEGPNNNLDGTVRKCGEDSFEVIVADQGTWATNPRVWLAIAFPVLVIAFSISCYLVAWGHMPLNEKGQTVVEAVVHPILGVIAAVLCAIAIVISEDPLAFGLCTAFLAALVVLFVKHSLKSNPVKSMEGTAK